MGRYAWIWPAFVAACVLEALVFAFVDPLELHWAGQVLEWSRLGTYTAAFFAFWAVTLAACATAALLGPAPAARRTQGAGRSLG